MASTVTAIHVMLRYGFTCYSFCCALRLRPLRCFGCCGFVVMVLANMALAAAADAAFTVTGFTVLLSAVMAVAAFTVMTFAVI